MGTAISCAKCSQVAGLFQKFGRDSSKAPSLCAAVLSAAPFHSKIVHSDDHQVLSVCKHMHINKNPLIK